MLGRQREQEALGRLLEVARGGRGAVLVVYGDPGVGKTALLEHAIEAGPDFQVVRAGGVEGEMELAFAALQQLCAPVLGLSERLPAPQREALSVAFGSSAGHPPDPFLVGLAVLGLVSEAAEERPLLCLVDDAQWLDGSSARALAFVARRLMAERIAFVFAAREPGAALAGFPEVHVGPLGHRDARALLESVLPGRLDDRVVERIVLETRGNPLALLELPRGLSPAQLAGGFGLPASLPLSAGIEESFRRRLAKLPRDARRLVLLAAADPLGDPALVWRAAQRLGIPESAVRTVESEGLVTLGEGVAFRHPLVRSAVYGAAAPNERHEAHGALAEATDPQIDPDRRAWHRAQAACVPDEELAGELERSAARAQARGGFAAAAAFLERAAMLTPAALAARSVPWSRLRRCSRQARSTTPSVCSLPPKPARSASSIARGSTCFARRSRSSSTHGRDAPELLLSAARRRTALETLACETYLEALSAAMFAGRLAAAGELAMSRPRPGRPARPSRPRAADLWLDGLAAVHRGPATRPRPFRPAPRAFGADDIGPDEGSAGAVAGGRAAGFIWDDGRGTR